MSDVTIPSDVAQSMAREWRALYDDKAKRGMYVTYLREWADLLDPKKPTLRDEVAAVISANRGHDASCVVCHRDADAVLAVVKARIKALPTVVSHIDSEHFVSRDDVLALFGDES